MDSTYIFIIVVLIILIGGFLLLSIVSKKTGSLDHDFFQRKWSSIEDKMRDNQYSMAVIEADKLLDEAMKKRGVRGETMGDRLKNAENIIRDIDAAWNAHKLRNKIVHESDFSLGKKQTKRAIGQFKRSLKSVGVKL